MKQLLLIAALCACAILKAQVGIGTTTPDASACLDISSLNKGVLFPRVSLSTTTTQKLDGVNVASAGLLIYNTNSSISGIGARGEGYYHFDGSVWAKFAMEDDGPVYGEVHRTSTQIGVASGTPIGFDGTGPSKGSILSTSGVKTGRAGVYRITFTVSAEQISSGGSEEVEFFLVQDATEVPGSRVYIDVSQDPDFVTATKSILVDVTAANQDFYILPDHSTSNVEILSGTSLNIELID